MLKKKNTTAYIRLIIQILFLFLMPGLFTMIFGEMKQLYTGIINGNINLMAIIPLLILIPLTVIFGRIFCGYMCAFGTVNDLLYEFSSRILKIEFKINKDLDKLFKLIKYFILLFIIIVIWTLGFSNFNKFNPWDAFAEITQFPPSISNIIALSVLILIFIGAIFIERFFCRYLCPLGAFLSLLQALRIVKIDKNKSTCLNGCRRCTTSCSMGIDLDKVDKVNSIECIQCMNCTGVCPKSNAKVTLFNKIVNEIVIVLIFIFTFLGFKLAAQKLIDFKMSYKGNDDDFNIQEHTPIPNGKRRHRHDGQEASNQIQNVEVKEGKYKDGKYTGTAIGFKPGLTVEVTISGGKISKIEILDHNETPSYAETPFKIIPDEIIKNQSTKVDAVSGATRTSVGIMNAVAEALKKAEQQ